MKKLNLSSTLAVSTLAAILFVPSQQVSAGAPLASCNNGSGVVKHYDKIVFKVRSGVANQANQVEPPPVPPVPAGTELDIKVMDIVGEIADLKLKVLNALNVDDTPNNRDAIKITDVEYAIVCEDYDI